MIRFSIKQKINKGMELISISTAQNNQGDFKLLIIMLLHCNLPSLFNLYWWTKQFTSVIRKCKSLMETDILRVVCLFPKEKVSIWSPVSWIDYLPTILKTPTCRWPIIYIYIYIIIWKHQLSREWQEHTVTCCKSILK